MTRSLSDQLADARAEVTRLERQIASAICAEVGHRWRLIGGANCGCHDEADCSVPVHECMVCDDCDYGDNADATVQRERCREEREAALPGFALSIRQPWTWAILEAGKPVENRSWRAANPGLRFRGPVCIHAGQGMTRDEYAEAAGFMASIGVTCPPAADLKRGGIVGTAKIVDVVTDMDSPWFFGPYGLVLADAEPVDFIPVKGALGFFEWRRSTIDPQPPKQGALF